MHLLNLGFEALNDYIHTYIYMCMYECIVFANFAEFAFETLWKRKEIGDRRQLGAKMTKFSGSGNHSVLQWAKKLRAYLQCIHMHNACGK